MLIYCKTPMKLAVLKESSIAQQYIDSMKSNTLTNAKSVFKCIFKFVVDYLSFLYKHASCAQIREHELEFAAKFVRSARIPVFTAENQLDSERLSVLLRSKEHFQHGFGHKSHRWQFAFDLESERIQFELGHFRLEKRAHCYENENLLLVSVTWNG